MMSRLDSLTCPPQSSPQPRMGMGKLELRIGGLQCGDGLTECVQSLLTAFDHRSASQRDTQGDRHFIAPREENLFLDKHIPMCRVPAKMGDDAGK